MADMINLATAVISRDTDAAFQPATPPRDGHESATSGISVDYYWLSANDTNNQFCVNTGQHYGTEYAFDLTKYASYPCGNDGASNDPVAVRTTGYTSPGSITLRSDWYTGEYSDECDYAKAYLYSNGDGIYRGMVRYVHSRYPGASGYYGTLNIPAQHGGAAYAWGVANLTNDGDGCAWTGYHVHQGFPPESSGYKCRTGIATITPSSSPYTTWSTMIHKISYTEGTDC